MRLSEVLSKEPTEYRQVEGFLANRRLTCGKQRKIENSGNVLLNYYCKNCEDQRTFATTNTLYAIGIDDKHVSIDCTLKCVGCNQTVSTWFLIESEEEIADTMPKIRISRKAVKHSDLVRITAGNYDYSELLEKAECAYQNGLGAGAVVYLRKIFETLTAQVADASNVSRKTEKGRRKKFSDLLREVDSQKHIIPREFSNNGYELYSKLSNVVHGEYDEQEAVQNYDALKRLVVGIIENVSNNDSLANAVAALGLGGGETRV